MVVGYNQSVNLMFDIQLQLRVMDHTTLSWKIILLSNREIKREKTSIIYDPCINSILFEFIG